MHPRHSSFINLKDEASKPRTEIPKMDNTLKVLQNLDPGLLERMLELYQKNPKSITLSDTIELKQALQYICWYDTTYGNDPNIPGDLKGVYKKVLRLAAEKAEPTGATIGILRNTLHSVFFRAFFCMDSFHGTPGVY